MARKPNYDFERRERDKAKAEKKAERLKAKQERRAAASDDGQDGEIEAVAPDDSA